MTLDSPQLATYVLDVVYVVGVLLWCAYTRGIERGKYLERMEPPRFGEYNFHDGWMRETPAESATDAVELLMQSHFVGNVLSRGARRGTDGR